jgi:ribosome maturation factor RimP
MPRPQLDELRAELRPTVERAVAEVGFDLEDIDVRPAGRRTLVRVVVDADDGVGLDDIAALSRRVSVELDQRDAVLGGPYTLEVTSPGVDRPLTAPRHWRRARLRLVEVEPHEGGTFTGRVGDAGEEAVVLLVDGQLRRVRYTAVRRATVAVEFRHPPADELRVLGARPERAPGTVAGEAGGVGRAQPSAPSGAASDAGDRANGAGEVAEEHR